MARVFRLREGDALGIDPLNTFRFACGEAVENARCHRSVIPVFQVVDLVGVGEFGVKVRVAGEDVPGIAEAEERVQAPEVRPVDAAAVAHLHGIAGFAQVVAQEYTGEQVEVFPWIDLLGGD